MATPRTRRRTAVLVALYTMSTAGITIGLTCLYRGCYLAWAILMMVGIEALVWAYRVRTGRGPYRRRGTND